MRGVFVLKRFFFFWGGGEKRGTEEVKVANFGVGFALDVDQRAQSAGYHLPSHRVHQPQDVAGKKTIKKKSSRASASRKLLRGSGTASESNAFKSIPGTKCPATRVNGFDRTVPGAGGVSPSTIIKSSFASRS